MQLRFGFHLECNISLQLTLCKILINAVRGMMYHRKALELQAFLDMAKDEGNAPSFANDRVKFLYLYVLWLPLSSLVTRISLIVFFFWFVWLKSYRWADLREGYKGIEISGDNSTLWSQCEAVADMKFTYVVSCQQYGIHKRSASPLAQDILRLMTR